MVVKMRVIRACVVVLTCVFLSMCAHIPSEHKTAVQAHSSFVIVHQIGVFRAVLCDKGKICAPLGDPVRIKLAVGSGGVVGHVGSSTYILTAKHVVDEWNKKPRVNRQIFRSLLRSRAAIIKKLDDKSTVRFVGVRFEHYVDFSDGTRSLARGFDCDTRHDLCLVETPFHIKIPHVEVSPKPPYLGQEVFSATAPFGRAIPGRAVPFFDGRYSGTDYATSRYPSNGWYTFPSVPGSSGSLILTKDGKLVGLISAMSFGRFCSPHVGCGPLPSGVTISVSYRAIVQFMNKRLK